MPSDDTDEHQVDDGGEESLRDDADDPFAGSDLETAAAGDDEADDGDGVRTAAIEEVATGTGLYPSTVREALAELHDEDRVNREKRASEGAGNNPYEYTAIQPSELVGGVVDQVQQELNTIFALDRLLDRGEESHPGLEEGDEPVTITVDDTEPPEPATVEASGGSAADRSDTDADDEEGDAEPVEESETTGSASGTDREE